MPDQLSKTPQRKVAGQDQRGPQNVGDCRWNEMAGADKVLPVNGRFKKPYLGPLGAPVQSTIGANGGATVAVYNDSATTAYVATGADNTVAVTGPTDGIAIPPYSYTYVAMGTDQWIVGSAATVYGYELDDASYFGT